MMWEAIQWNKVRTGSEDMQRRRISSIWAGQPLIDAMQILILAVMGWWLWTIVKDDVVWIFAIYTAVTLFGCYMGFHMRRVELDKSNLYVGRFLRSGFVTIPIQQIQSIKLHRPLPNQIAIAFREETEAGSWIILIPRLFFLSTLSTHPDVVELTQLVNRAQAQPLASSAEGGERNPSEKTS